MLPPDNFQEDPKPVVAHRTSPTNIGLYLLSVVAARDFGWLGTLETVGAARGNVRDDGQAGALPRPFLQLVRHRATCARWSRNTSPRWIAAILPATLSRSAMPAARSPRRRSAIRSWVAGLEDVAGADPRGASTAQTVDGAGCGADRRHRCLCRGAPGAPANPAGIVRCLTDLAAKADRSSTLAVPARTSGGDAEIVDWANGLARDRRRTSAGLRSADALGQSAGRLRFARRRNWRCIDTMPTLATLPAHCEAVLQMLAAHREQSAANEGLDRIHRCT